MLLIQFSVEKLMVESSWVEAWGWIVLGWNILQFFEKIKQEFGNQYQSKPIKSELSGDRKAEVNEVKSELAKLQTEFQEIKLDIKDMKTNMQLLCSNIKLWSPSSIHALDNSK